jgi:hypothetical protein
MTRLGPREVYGTYPEDFLDAYVKVISQQRHGLSVVSYVCVPVRLEQT